jgi:phosphatidate cytidylyltransferase
MALNIQTFKIRAGTAVLFAAIMLAGLLINHWTFFILFSIIHFGCWMEYQKLVGLIDSSYAQINVFHKYGIMIAGWCVLLYFTNDAFTIFGGRLHAMGWWLGLIAVFLLPIMELLFARQVVLKNIGYSLLGLIYISLSWGLMMDLRCVGMPLKKSDFFIEWGYIIPAGLIFSIWINDTMAYVVGSLIGKTPFSKISPKKTWEGTAGGAILCVGMMALLGWFTKFYRVQDWIAIASIAAVVGTAGDLLESKLKRMAGVKDSGSLMPGHGGFLDRFDSLVLATPVVWLYVKLFM